MSNKNVLIAGVGGVLGRALTDAFVRKGIRPVGLALSEREFTGLDGKLTLKVVADVTKPATLEGVCAGIDLLISVIGITRIRGKVTHMDVDYQGNMNLLAEAKRSGVKKFVFISPAGTDLGAKQGVPLMEAKFKFEEELKKSSLDWVIVRSGGFMCDFTGMAKLARKGTMYIVGAGDVVCTPIEVGELASLMADDALNITNSYTSIGGPQDMTWFQICNVCFNVWGRQARILSVPVWACNLALTLIRPFSFQYYALGKSFVFFSLHNVPTEKRGKIGLNTYLQQYYVGKN